MKILITIPFEEEHLEKLRALCPQGEFDYCPQSLDVPLYNPALRAEQVQTAELILGNVPPSMLKDCKALRYLHLNSAGANGYTSDGILPKGAFLTNSTGAYGLSISEHMLALSLMLMRKLHLYYTAQRGHVWQERGSVRSFENAVVLCVGLGDIGGEFAKRAKALGAYTIGLRRSRTDKPDYLDELHLTSEMDSLLPRADLVALSLPSTPQTVNIMNRTRIEKMKRGAYLLNVGRGDALDESALIDALQSGALAGAALDVTAHEPLSEDDPLWDAPNLLITPHIAGGFYLRQTLDKIREIALDNFERYMKGMPLLHQVDLQTGYMRR